MAVEVEAGDRSSWALVSVALALKVGGRFERGQRALTGPCTRTRPSRLTGMDLEQTTHLAREGATVDIMAKTVMITVNIGEQLVSGLRILDRVQRGGYSVLNPLHFKLRTRPPFFIVELQNVYNARICS